jgi:2-aminomuconate deaminase
MSEITRTDAAPAPVGAYPHAKRVGDLLFLSGIGPRKPGTDQIPGVDPHDIEMQCRSVFENVRIVLEAAGSRWEDLVDVLVFLTDIERDFETYNRVYAEYFADAQPCRTTVEISKLPTPIAIELKCIASVGEHQAS